MILLLSSLSLARDIVVPVDGDLVAVCKELRQETETEQIRILVDPGRSAGEGACELVEVDDVVLESSAEDLSAYVDGVVIVASSRVHVERLELGVNDLRTNVYSTDSLDLTLKQLSLVSSESHGVFLQLVEGAWIEGLVTELPGSTGSSLVKVTSSSDQVGTQLLVDGVEASGPWARVDLLTGGEVEVVVEDLRLEGGVSGGEGGCLAVDAGGSAIPVTLVNIELSGCEAQGDGGAAHLSSGSFEVLGATLQGSTAQGQGGGLFFASGDVLVQDAVIADNRCESLLGGGGVAGGRNAGFTGSELSINNNQGGGLSTQGSLSLSGGQICGNDIGDRTGSVGAALTVIGTSTDFPVDLSRVEVRGNTANSFGLIYVNGGAVLDMDHLSVWDNQAERLANAERLGALSSSLIADVAVGYDSAETWAGSFNYWFQVDTPNAGGGVHPDDLVGAGLSDPGLGGWPAGGECGIPLYLDPGSPLVDAGDPARSDPDGDPVEDIGAHWLGETPRDTGETGETGETAAPETGEPEVQPLEVTLLGGCGRSPAGSAALLLGVALLLGRRERAQG